MKPILEVREVGKKYKIDHLRKEGSYLSLREKIPQFLQLQKTVHEDFWALQDITFSLDAGDTVGIIGRNGAGKSTLLKILSQITPPTTGRIISRGRIASLLEVGTGFHPELTGRENVFFNGSLLGMKRREIELKFDEIVDFSGVEKFLDTPLKHYSSGMQLRLAFAVAAFLEPEILIIDEVLAVGDAEFQRKCLGKMNDVSKSGRTILFVSHNMQAIANLCTKGICLVNGKISAMDTIQPVIEQYLKINHDSPQQLLHLKKDNDFSLGEVGIYQEKNPVQLNVVNGKEIEIRVAYELYTRLPGFRVFLDVFDQFGTLVFRSFHDEQAQIEFTPGHYVSSLAIPPNLLAPIPYDFKLQFGIHNVRMMEPAEGYTFRLEVEQTGAYNFNYHGQYTAGIICPALPWKIQRIENGKN